VYSVGAKDVAFIMRKAINCNKWLYCETAHLNSVNVTNKLHTVHSMWHAFSAISARVFLAFSSVAARGVEETRELHNDVI